MRVCVCAFYYCCLALAWLISSWPSVTARVKHTTRAGAYFTWVTLILHASRGRAKDRERERGGERERRPQKIIDQIFLFVSVATTARAVQINRLGTPPIPAPLHTARPLPLLRVPFICCCQANKQINSQTHRLPTTPFPPTHGNGSSSAAAAPLARCAPRWEWTPAAAAG